MKKQGLISASESGAGSLYLQHTNLDTKINRHNGDTIISTKIKGVDIKVIYDKHATVYFTFEEIMGDFWGKVYEMCKDNNIDWRQ